MDPLLTTQLLSGPNAGIIILAAWVMWMRRVNEDLKKENDELRKSMERQWITVEKAIRMLHRIMKDLGIDQTSQFTRDEISKD